MTIRTRLIAPCCALVLALLPARGDAQQVVELGRIRDHVHQRVTVEGKVADARRQRSGEVWMSLERGYPNGPLVIVLTPEVLNAFPDFRSFRGKTVRVTGLVRPSGREAPPGPVLNYGTERVDPPGKPYIVLDNSALIEVIAPD